MFGFRLFDKVLFEEKELLVTTRRKSGYFKVTAPDRSYEKDGVSYKKLTLLEKARRTLTFPKIRKLEDILSKEKLAVTIGIDKNNIATSYSFIHS